MPAMSSIRALVFDFDGLILDTETCQINAWKEVHRQAGITFPHEHAHSIVCHTDIDFDPWIAFPPEHDRAALAQAQREHNHACVRRQPILPGILDTLDAAEKLGLRLALASNSTHAWVDPHLQRLGLFSRFEIICCREDVPNGKPAPDLYQRAIAHLGVRPHEAIAFEDSRPGTLAAKAAGLWCAAIPNPSTRHHDFSHCDWLIDSLAAVPLPILLTATESPGAKDGQTR